MWVVEAYLTNEGEGAAFNVRFGVEFVGVRYPFRLNLDDPQSGNIQRVVRCGERLPEREAWPILLTSLDVWGRAGESVGAGKPGTLDSERIYWARYENARGQTWETRNPGDRSARLDIRRVRIPTRVDRQEQRRRVEAGAHDEKWVGEALAELRARVPDEGPAQVPNDPQGRSKGDDPGDLAPERRKPRG